MIEFNINNDVWIKLTDRGRDEYLNFYSSLSERSGVELPAPPIKEDEDGWSRWQLWHLMSILGSACFMGPQTPFETTIRLDAPVQPGQTRND